MYIEVCNPLKNMISEVFFSVISYRIQVIWAGVEILHIEKHKIFIYFFQVKYVSYTLLPSAVPIYGAIGNVGF